MIYLDRERETDEEVHENFSFDNISSCRWFLCSPGSPLGMSTDELGSRHLGISATNEKGKTSQGHPGVNFNKLIFMAI
jgi:hypothetical protein